MSTETRLCAGHPCREGSDCHNPWCPFAAETRGRCQATDDAYGRCLLDTHDGDVHAYEGISGPPGPPQRWQTAETPGGGGHTEAIERVLRENGLTDRPDQYDSNIHSWRCEHPDRYGSCDCFAELVTDLAAAAVQARAEVVARVEALCRDARYDVVYTHDLRAALAGSNPRGGQDGGGE